MTRERTYLDYNASAPLRPEARAAIAGALEVCGNPSSVHAEGRAARGLVETAREAVAALVNARPAEVVFTSGATEANNWAIAGAEPGTIFVAGIEHESVLQPARAGNAGVISIPVTAAGTVSLDALAQLLAEHGKADGRALVAVQMANNETGAVQPVAEVAALAREHGAVVHTDAVQAPGRVPVDFAAMGVATMALSAHKTGGPAGVGALIVRDGVKLAPFIRGGGQERRRRAGTENVAGIAGFGAAAKAAARDLANIERVRALRDRLEAEVLAATPTAVVIGADAERLANTACIAVPGFSAETLVIKLDLAGIAVSAGSACSSGKVAESHVLNAMGISPEVAQSAIRVSIGVETGEREIAAFLAAWKAVTGGLSIAA